MDNDRALADMVAELAAGFLVPVPATADAGQTGEPTPGWGPARSPAGPACQTRAG